MLNKTFKKIKSIKTIYKLFLLDLFVALAATAFLQLTQVQKQAYADNYPSGCAGCRAAGGWCVENGSGYRCGSSGSCSYRVSDTLACPSGCSCGRYHFSGGSTSCGNDCIGVESCGSAPPPPPPPPPGGGGGSSCGSCSDYCAGSGECSGAGGTQVGSRCSGGSCSPGTAPCLICSGGGGGGGAPPPAPKVACGGRCNQASDCAFTPTGFQPICVNNKCVNPNCPNNSEASANCYCTVASGLCGDQCGNWPGGSKPNCNPASGSSCAPADQGTYCPTLNNTYCLPLNPQNGYRTAPCGNPNWTYYLYLVAPNGQPVRTQAQIREACAPPNHAWWQVKDGDVISNGDLVSKIPGSCLLPGCNPAFDLKGTGGFPGLPIYLNNYDFSDSTADQGIPAEGVKPWLANSLYASGIETYNYSYLSKQIPSDVTINQISASSVNGGFFNSGGAQTRGYAWFHKNGDLTINNGDVNIGGTRKVILLIEGGDLTINGRINIQSPGDGFFMAIVGKGNTGNKGNIIVSPGVSNQSIDIEGLYIADGQIRTSTNGARNDDQLYVRGSLIGLGGVLLQRDLQNNATVPAEVVEFSPQLFAAFPKELMRGRVVWQEIAP